MSKEGKGMKVSGSNNDPKNNFKSATIEALKSNSR